LTDPSQLAELERNFTLLPAEIAAINPNTKTAPVFRSRSDAVLTAKIYSHAPALVKEEGKSKTDPWSFDYATKLFDMADDSPIFMTAEQLSKDGFSFSGLSWSSASPEVDKYVPLYEAKMVHHFDHRWSGYTLEDATPVDYSPEYKAEPNNEVVSRYWVDELEVKRRVSAKGWTRSWLMGWRDITNATNERTVISSIVPWTGVGHTLRLMHVGSSAPSAAAFLANSSAIALDFVARQKVGGTHLTVEMWKQLPILPPEFYTERRLAFITPKVLELTYTSHSLAPFARDLGHDGPPFAWDEDRRALLRADLDAFYARAYGLTRDELRYILDPADVKGPDYPSETFRVLKEKEIRQHGEYRTRRLVLEAWDRMAQDGTFAALGMADRATAVAQQFALSPLNQYEDAMWAWPQGINERDRVRAQLRAMVGILPGPSDARRVRLAALACLQPGLLDGFLSETDRREWQRLMAHSTGATQLVPPTNAAWGAAFNELVSSAVLDVSSDGTHWSAGSRLDRSTLNASDPAVGRAIFAWSRLEAVDLDHGLSQVSAVILPFIREGRLAA
jgi:hypothetical protein